MLGKLIAALMMVGFATSAPAGDIAVIVHPSAPALTKEQVYDIFLGRTPRALPVDLAKADPVRTVFYARATGRDPDQVREIWARVLFTGKGLAPKEYPDAAAVKRAVADNPRVVGYIDKAAVDSTVKVAYVLSE